MAVSNTSLSDADLELGSGAVAARREMLFKETPTETVERWVLGTAWALKPKRIASLPALASMWLRDFAAPRRELPDPNLTYDDTGMCGIAHDLSVDTLPAAYRRGLFTFAHFGPLKWMSPVERCVLFFDEMRSNKNVLRLARQGRYKVTFDRAFEDVIKSCAGRRTNKWHVTWITPQIMHAYARLFDAGYVHSFEVWNEQDVLVGGGYGVAIGGAFFTESQFSHESNTSKLGFAVLNRHLEAWGFAFNDGKSPTPALAEIGCRLISREEFLERLQEASQRPGRPGRWTVELALEKPAPAKKSAAAA